MKTTHKACDDNLEIGDSPLREKRLNLFPLKFTSSSKRSNFENRNEWTESRASERNGPFGE
jgi:hypothetical protein